MRRPFDFVRRLLSSVGRSPAPLLQLFTPATATPRSGGTRLILAAATVTGLVSASLFAVGALAALTMALAVIYFLATQVLGLRLDVDPRAFVERAQQYAARGPFGQA